mmetsp:Transcript_16828/g.22580  ORF Transcript_16828/g.22580 Transcript_16828/m.22580 type:complete len:110 (-) Transcript_16828:827-1156(-)
MTREILSLRVGMVGEGRGFMVAICDYYHSCLHRNYRVCSSYLQNILRLEEPYHRLSHLKNILQIHQNSAEGTQISPHSCGIYHLCAKGAFLYCAKGTLLCLVRQCCVTY